LKAPVLITVLVLLLSGTGTLRAQEPGKRELHDLWLARDKASHLALSAALVGFGYHLLHYEQQERKAPSRNLALGVTLGMGLAKEARDSSCPGNHFSFKDLAADLLGAGLGIIIFTTK